ncbi:unnamed protein product [Urochloa decumbens]|uniref:BTB domain-containing protein n=1 Tax=Urochloa decumbens TaxID=240449 RepID=A0ABC9E1L7_9POAL
MENGSTNLTEAARSVHLLKINGYSATSTMSTSEYIRSQWNFDGYEWEIQFYPMYFWGIMNWLALKLKFLGGPLKHKQVRASLSCRIADPSGNLEPSSKVVSTSHIFQDHQDCSSPVFLDPRGVVRTSGYIKKDALAVECTITVLKELKDTPLIPAKEEAPLPSSDLHQHLGELLVSQTGADITFIVSGERFPAHKNILAARSSVFRAEFFGNTNGRGSQCVQVNDMEPAVFKAMLRFIYTDIDEEPGMAATMPRRLLAAANRYGLQRLKLICERKLSGGINVDTAATTLALAEQHSCLLLKAKCIEFITGSPERLDAVLATEGYKHLAASYPLALAELLKAAHGRKN